MHTMQIKAFDFFLGFIKLNIFYRFGDACDNCPDDRNPDQGTGMKWNI